MATKRWTGGAGDGNFNTDENWSPTGKPAAASDTIVFRDSDKPVIAGLDQSATGTFASVTIEQTQTGAIGTANEYLQIRATLVFVGQYNGFGTPTGAGLIKLDLGNVASTVRVYATADAASDNTDLPPVRIKANSASTDVEVLGGKVGVAIGAGETTTLSNIQVGNSESTTDDPYVICGAGCTADPVIYGGTLEFLGISTSIEVRGGVLVLDTSDSITNYDIWAGTAYLDRFGTITNANFRGGTTDFTRSTITSRTCTNSTVYKPPSGGTVIKRASTGHALTNGLTIGDRMLMTTVAI